MQRRYDTPESQRLVNAVFNGTEWDSWDLQLQRIERSYSMRGRHEIRIESPKRAVVATVYASKKLSALYVLGYHIDRKGEPTENQRTRVNDYVAEIEKLEQE